MRILQLIDSLEAGGAERMAVNYANALQKEISFSALCATRKEGALKESLSPEVSYIFLDKKKSLDFKALFKLRSFVKTNQIEFIHAHSSSFFTAVLLKFSCPKIKIIWHDHYGNSEFLEKRDAKALKIMSHLFLAVISVNQQLREWAVSQLNCKKVVYLPNFASFENSLVIDEPTFLRGAEHKRIVCLANLRPQKGHLFLLDVAEKIKLIYPDWTFHLVGKDFKDDYSRSLDEAISLKKLIDNVFVYGSKNDVQNIINQADICILTSESEGLPVALLEYGFNKKAVITTDVGEIGTVIADGENGLLIDYQDVMGFVDALSKLILKPELAAGLSQNLYETIIESYSQKGILENYLKLLI